MEEEADTGEGEANLGKEGQKQENVEADIFISKAIRSVEFGNWPRKFLKEKKKKVCQNLQCAANMAQFAVWTYIMTSRLIRSIDKEDV